MNSNYSSPEQVTGKPLEPRSDVYSLGGIIYFMMTGEHPVSAIERIRAPKSTLADVTYQLLNRGVKVSPAKVIAAAMSLNPEDRPTVKELINALSTVLDPPYYSDPSYFDIPKNKGTKAVNEKETDKGGDFLFNLPVNLRGLFKLSSKKKRQAEKGWYCIRFQKP